MVSKCSIILMLCFMVSGCASFTPHPVLKALEEFVENIMERDKTENENPVLVALREFVKDIIDDKQHALNVTMEREMATIRQNFNDSMEKLNKQIPAFHAMLSKNVMLTAEQTVVFDQVITNIGEVYNPNTGHFTAPRDGVYFFNVAFLKIGPYNVHLKMMQNSIIISRGHATNSASGSTTGTMAAAVHLVAGDVVKIVGYNANEHIHGQWSFFTGYMISNNI